MHGISQHETTSYALHAIVRGGSLSGAGISSPSLGTDTHTHTLTHTPIPLGGTDIFTSSGHVDTTHSAAVFIPTDATDTHKCSKWIPSGEVGRGCRRVPQRREPAQPPPLPIRLGGTDMFTSSGHHSQRCWKSVP